MTEQTPASHTPPPPALFDPLEATDFQRLEHAASLKGLLKPFKGKGELESWAKECEQLRDSLLALAQRLLAQGTTYPFNRLPVLLAQQTTSAGTAFLRWRYVDRSAMGVLLWDKLVTDPRTPTPLVHELYALEIERIAINMQVSLTHTISRQAHACAQKMAQAESRYRERLITSTGHSPPGVLT